MRHYFARLLRRAANRLDPPRYWGNVLTPNTSICRDCGARWREVHACAGPQLVRFTYS